MPREVLLLTSEAIYGTYQTGAQPADKLVIDLPQNNAWTMRAKLNKWTLRSSGASNLKTKTGQGTVDFTGKLMTPIRPSQTLFLMGLVGTLTAGNCPDLGSFTADHGILLDDGSCTLVWTRYLGCKFGGGSFKLDNTPQGSMLMGDFDVTAATKVDAPSGLSVPALSAYPFDETPWLRSEAALTIGSGGGSAREFESLTLDIKNNLKGYRPNGPYLSRLRNFGRDPSLTATLLFASLQDRLDYEAILAKAAKVVFTRPVGTNGSKVLTLDFGAKNYLGSVDDALNLDDFHRQTVMLENFLDGAAGTDLTVTYVDTPPT